ncbi:alpha/beta hydrolase [Haloferula sp.]|uniref:alpha/beta hydrolase n=1 Tax=Haloferula sp. TaxID=2497595 RepID=UPI00329D7603
MKPRPITSLVLLGISITLGSLAQEVEPTQPLQKAKNPVAYDSSVPKPTFSNVQYGLNNRNVLDFWKAESVTPTPLVLVIHGGGWMGGRKEAVHKFAEVGKLLKAGISVAAINYRYLTHAKKEGVKPPVKAPLHDAARALQFVRSRVKEWNIDGKRIAATGGSAGGCSSLWLAFRDDLANPGSDDPVARESTRLWCAAVTGAQTSLDPKQMTEWTPNNNYGAKAFGLSTYPEFMAARDQLLPSIKKYSPYALVSAGDPPIYLIYDLPPTVGEKHKNPTHTSNFGLMLQKQCIATGVHCELVYQGVPEVKHESTTAFLIENLKR